MGSSVQWAEVFRSLTFVVPETAFFETVHIEGTPPALVIKGSVLAPTAARANADFTGLFNGLRGLPYFSSVTLSKPLAVTNEDVSGVTPVSLLAQSRISFEVQCELISRN